MIMIRIIRKMEKRIELLNDCVPSLDQELNGKYYDLENADTAVIYQFYNMNTKKSYIGKAYSFVKNGVEKNRRHGSKDRFYKHWIASESDKDNDCPVFYKVLRKSNPLDWFILTIKVCSKQHAKEWETKLIKLHKTYDPKYGYNYFVGDNRPADSVYLKKYQSAKAKSNADRAIGGGLRQKEHSKNLPPNINYRRSEKNGTVTEGYFVQIRLNGKLYNKAFLSKFDSMENKLELAKNQLALFRKEDEEANKNTPKKKNTPVKKSTTKKRTTKKRIIKSGSKTLRTNKK